ncbi:hypothetical protein GCM10011357_04020 [Lacimicrobium alkaliphilum]|uniref:Thioredoxin domain-containing protein n=1 Tax=Lacimicrobium alkaliphilum TaxID=1526571 RepID=A0ABQ1QXV2_9ALTE|nr:hypothetical protein GCM10011357_04020 [Lacimicrobium alkaliphilum]
MHYGIYLLFLMLLSPCLSANQANSSSLAGELKAEQLLSQYPEFNQEYQRYVPENAEIQAMQVLYGKSVLVFLGTWCHDSEREVPRLLKLLHRSQVDLQSLQLIAVGLDKKDPSGLAQRFNLLYTPTIIVLDDEQELYRMVERPKGSLALDLQQGLTGRGESRDESI